MIADTEKGKHEDFEQAEYGSGLEDVDSSTTDSRPSVHDQIHEQSQPITLIPTRCSEKQPGNALSRTLTGLSRVSTAIPLTPPPDGGTQAYLQIVGGMIGMGMPWGVINTWGVCQSYYTSELLPTYPQSTIAWIGSLQVTLTFLVGIFSGRAADAGYYYPLSIGGMALQVFALFMTSLATQYWQLVLAQGLCFGLGIGISFPPIATLLSTYFEKKRAMALSVAAAGTSIFGMVFPVVLKEMLPRFGFGWAIRTIAFLVMFFYIIAIMLLRWRLPPRTTGPWIDYSAFSDRPYIFGTLGMFFAFWALYFGFFYIGVFATTEIGLTETKSINLLLVMVGIGIPARVITGQTADRVTGPLTIQVPLIFLAGIMLLAWIAVKDVPGLYAFSAIYGYCAAGVQGLFPALISSLSSDIRVRGTRLGMAFFCVSFAVLSGPPIAGALISKRDGDFLYAQIWAALSMFVGVSFMTMARYSKIGWDLKAKA